MMNKDLVKKVRKGIQVTAKEHMLKSGVGKFEFFPELKKICKVWNW